MKPKEPNIEDRMRWDSEDNAQVPTSASQTTQDEPQPPSHEPSFGETIRDLLGH